jgi:hypothetical protein
VTLGVEKFGKFGERLGMRKILRKFGVRAKFSKYKGVKG